MRSEKIKSGLKIFIAVIITLMLVPVAYAMCHFKEFRREYYKMTIAHNLKTKYGEEFKCISVSIDGGAITFVSYPEKDQSLLFDGLVGSYDTYPGVIISKDDSLILEEYMSSELGDVFVYCMPDIQSDSETTHMINVGRNTPDELRSVSYYPRRFFYVILNVSSAQNRTSEDEYDMILRSTNEFIEFYKQNYDLDIIADLRIIFVNSEEYEFAKTYFQTHVGTDYEFNREIMSLPIVMEIGDPNSFSSESRMITKEEYVAQRRDILERYGR